MPSRVHRPALAWATALVLLLAACSPSPSTTPEPDGSEPGGAASEPAATPEPSPSLAAFDHGDIPPELVGIYELTVMDHYEQTRYVELNADGTWAYHDGPLNYGQPVGETLVTGQYGVFGSEIVFGAEVGDGGFPCLSDGRYAWTLEGDTLTMVVVDDPCTLGRVDDWQVGWIKLPGS